MVDTLERTGRAGVAVAGGSLEMEGDCAGETPARGETKEDIGRREVGSGWEIGHAGCVDPRLFLKREGGRRSLLSIGGQGVRCPKCGWCPGPRDVWQCSCGCVWNTFQTRGVCPECGHAWQDTQCLRCMGWSRHEDWYVEDPAGR
jgi:hypothetical protein